ncbi:unnamed protein product [Blepharisma stoltei]|uniref:Transmembrane protein n=1 Tax=Blepharisma stoltei TaxID=1481888 RepID=A0AAU9KG08_9CILI|nr:unnamed protein product [Blepharisma stoltei]
MLIPNRKRITIKLVLDCLYIGCAISLYFIDIFQYMDHYYIGLTYITYEYSYNGLDAFVTASFNDFDDHFCDTSSSAVSEICDNKEDWQTAGIIFIIVSSIAHLIMVYGMLNLFGKACKCTLWGSLKINVQHYIYSAVYCASVITYVLIAGIFTLTPPKGYNSNYDIKVQPGIILMFFSAFFAIISVLYYLLYKNSMNSDPFVEQNEYKSLPENKEENKSISQKESFGRKTTQKYEEEKKEEEKVSRSSEFSDNIEFDKDAISSEESKSQGDKKSQKSEDKKSQKSEDKTSQKSNEKTKKIIGK